jgi:hypothetical protein
MSAEYSQKTSLHSLPADPFADSRRNLIETLATCRNFEVMRRLLQFFSPSVFSVYVITRAALSQGVLVQKHDGRYSNGHSGLVLNGR